MGWSPEARRAAADARRLKRARTRSPKSRHVLGPGGVISSYGPAYDKLTTTLEIPPALSAALTSINRGNKATDYQGFHIEKRPGGFSVSDRNDPAPRKVLTFRNREQVAAHVVKKMSTRRPKLKPLTNPPGRSALLGKDAVSRAMEKERTGGHSQGARRARSLMQKIVDFDDPTHDESDIDKLVGRGFSLQKIDQEDIETGVQLLYPGLKLSAALDRFSGHLDSRNNTLMERMWKWAEYHKSRGN